ncbi:MAG: hypothetical protein ACK5V4_02675, partial [Alphaproteobacteria bacterium]
TGEAYTLQSIYALRNQDVKAPQGLFIYSMYFRNTNMKASELYSLLSSNKSLKKIRTQGTDFIQIDLTKITTSLRTNPWFINNLIYLNISGYNLSTTYETCLNNISLLTNLESLSISNNVLQVASGTSIAACISQLRKLKALDIPTNYLMGGAVSNILSSLNLNVIEKLNLSQPSLENEVFASIAKYLSDSPNLNTLLLEPNAFVKIAESPDKLFTNHSRLTCVSLSFNRIDDVGMQKFLNAINSNRSILLLQLHSNRTYQAFTAFVKKWQRDRDNLLLLSYPQHIDSIYTLKPKYTIYQKLAARWIEAHEMHNNYASLDISRLTAVFRYKAAISHTLYNETNFLPSQETYKHMERKDILEFFERNLSNLWRNKWTESRGISKTYEILPQEVMCLIASFLDYRDIKYDAAPQL